MKEPTEGKIAEELIGNKPIRKHRLRQKWTPALFATFLLYHNPFLAWQDPIFVRKKFPNLFPKCSDKTASIKIGKLMNAPKFDHITADYLKTIFLILALCVIGYYIYSYNHTPGASIFTKNQSVSVSNVILSFIIYCIFNIPEPVLSTNLSLLTKSINNGFLDKQY